MDKSTISAFCLAIGGLITTVAAFAYAYYTKIENDFSTNSVLEEQRFHAKQSINRITEKTGTILSEMSLQSSEYKVLVQSKYKETFKNLTELNSSINDSKKQLSRQVKSLASPLRPFQAHVIFTVDYKAVDSSIKELIKNLAAYFESFPDYGAVMDMHREIILHYKDKTAPGKLTPSGKVTSICNTRLQYKRDYNGGGRLGIIQGQFMNAFMPLMSLYLNAEKFDNIPFMQSDLVFNLVPAPYDVHVPANIEYRISLEEETIYFDLTIDDPAVSYDNGRIISLNDCQEGELALMFHKTYGEEIKLNVMYLGLGSQYLISKQLDFKERANPYDLPEDKGRQFFYVEGNRLPQ